MLTQICLLGSLWLPLECTEIILLPKNNRKKGDSDANNLRNKFFTQLFLALCGNTLYTDGSKCQANTLLKGAEI
jgi:hypothetical protein